MNQVKIIIRDEELLEKWIAFKEITKCRKELDRSTIKKSMNDFFQELLSEALDAFFQDLHEPIINKTVKSTVRRVFRDEMKYFINDLKEVNLNSKIDNEYIIGLLNVIYKTNTESLFKSDDDTFFDKDNNVHEEFLQVPISLHDYKAKLETKRQIMMHDFKKIKKI